MYQKVFQLLFVSLFQNVHSVEQGERVDGHSSLSNRNRADFRGKRLHYIFSSELHILKVFTNQF